VGESLTTQIEWIEVDRLDPHPDNPRLFLREDVIEGITAQLEESGAFDPAHALLVRPVNGRYQIVRGHHRVEGARRAGMDKVPCWVRDLSDDEAYMQLALGNVQGELSPLEIGIHALKAVDTSDGGRGIVGGVSEYARQLGQDRGNLTAYRQGAEVLAATKNLCNVTQVLDKAKHLASVHRLPRELWPFVAEWVVTPQTSGKENSTPSVNQTQDLVKDLLKFEIPEQWAFFLPVVDVARAYMADGQPTPDIVARLIQQARATEEAIKAHCERLDPERFTFTVDDFHEWLLGGIGTYAWDVHELDAYRQRVIEQAKEAERPPKPDAQPGEWYRMGKHSLYCGDTGDKAFWESLPQAAFAFADPPYNAEVADWDSGFRWDHDWLIWKAPIVAVTPGIESIQHFYSVGTKMPHAWAMSAWIDNGMTRGKVGFGNWVYIGLFAREGISLHRNAQDVIRVSVKTSDTDDSDHKGRKPPELMAALIELFSEPEQVVVDPFLGSGTTLFEADRLGRICIGGEIRPDFCNAIIERWQEQTGRAAERIV